MSDHSNFTINAHAITEKRQRRGLLALRQEKSHRGYVCVCVCVYLQTNLWKYNYTFMLSVMCLLGKVNNYSSVLAPGKQDLVSKLGKFQANKDALVTLPLGHDGIGGGVGG